MDSNKFKINKVKTGSVFAIVIALIGIGLRFMRIQERQERQQRQESQRVALSRVQSLQSVLGNTSTKDPIQAAAGNRAYSVLQSLAQASKTSETTVNSETLKYDKYTPVDGTFSLGQIGNTFYVVDPKTQHRTPLDNTTEAYVVEIDNQDKKSLFGAIVAKVGNEWLVYVNEAKKLGSLGDINITHKTRRIIIKNGDAKPQ